MIIASQTQLGFTVHLSTDLESAIQRIKEALKMEGFGVLTEIDLKDTFKKKLDVDFRPYRIFGACNPSLAYRALTANPQVGLLLPCNVVVSQETDGIVEVSLVDPISMLGVVHDLEVEPVAQEARARLERVALSLQNN